MWDPESYAKRQVQPLPLRGVLGEGVLGMNQRETQPARRKRRRWLQYSLRTFLIFTLAVGAGLGWLGIKMDRARRQKMAVEAIRKAHASGPRWAPNSMALRIGHRSDKLWALWPVEYAPSSDGIPDWLVHWLGDDFFYDVHSVNLYAEEFTDDDLEHLRVLTELRRLSIEGPRITDKGLANLRGLAKLERFSLTSDRVTGAGLVHLKGMAQLERLGLEGRRICDQGLVHLAGRHRVTMLVLSSDEVTDDGLLHLAGLANLEELYLNCPQVTDAGLKHLTQLSRVRELELKDIRVSGSGLTNLSMLRNLEAVTLAVQVADGGQIRFRPPGSLDRTHLEGVRFDGVGIVDLSDWETAK